MNLNPTAAVGRVAADRGVGQGNCSGIGIHSPACQTRPCTVAPGDCCLVQSQVARTDYSQHRTYGTVVLPVNLVPVPLNGYGAGDVGQGCIKDNISRQGDDVRLGTCWAASCCRICVCRCNGISQGAGAAIHSDVCRLRLVRKNRCQKQP